ncbi:Uncharacterised protein [Mycobacterium tuberculosis]|nr:Uncharacterised protein [Mycobacterium tuberculosis]
MASERITSSVTTHPALRMTCASPSLMPSVTVTRASSGIAVWTLLLRSTPR